MCADMELPYLAPAIGGAHCIARTILGASDLHGSKRARWASQLRCGMPASGHCCKVVLDFVFGAGAVERVGSCGVGWALVRWGGVGWGQMFPGAFWQVLRGGVSRDVAKKVHMRNAQVSTCGEERGKGTSECSHSPPPILWLGVSGACVGAGVGVIVFRRPSARRKGAHPTRLVVCQSSGVHEWAEGRGRVGRHSRRTHVAVFAGMGAAGRPSFRGRTAGRSPAPPMHHDRLVVWGGISGCMLVGRVGEASRTVRAAAPVCFLTIRS